MESTFLAASPSSPPQWLRPLLQVSTPEPAGDPRRLLTLTRAGVASIDEPLIEVR